MSIAKDFFKKLQNISENEPLIALFLNKYLHYSEALSFQTILNEYARCFGELTADSDKKELSKVFWEILESFKLPLIEVSRDGSSQVYFLYRKHKENGNDLYVQGDFHGYGSTLASQRLNRKGDTDVMCCITPINKEFANALITYHFLEVPPQHQNKRSDYFYIEHPELKDFVDKKENWLPDPHAKHTKAYEKNESQFCVNAENDMASWRVSEIREWPSIAKIQEDPRLIHLVQKPNGRIVSGIASFADDLRSIHVFKPTEKVENVVIVNDGFAYLLCDIVNQLQNFAVKAKCVFIFISPHVGLGNPKDHELGVRGLEYHWYIDQYSAFILNALLPELNKQGVLPDPHPTNMTVIGASLSGTAALRMGLMHPQFRQVIAHSPTPFSRELIDQIPEAPARASRMRIDIECGRFENPDHAQANDNLSYARELGRLLKVVPHVGLHGHQSEAFVVDLNRSLPAILVASHIPGVQGPKKSTEPPTLDADEKTGIYEISEPLKKTMHDAGITRVSVASLDNAGKIKLGQYSSEKEAPTQFAAASLSKPVFAYLVLKLIEKDRARRAKGQASKFKLPSGVDEFNLDTPLHKVFPDIFKRFKPEDHDKVKKLTARMVLAHTTGLPITHNDADGPLAFLFSPGTNYCYSGPGIRCLQDVIEHITDSKLETLAKHYVFTPCKMHNSSFHYDKSKPPEAANSLYTTPLDYIKFIRKWLHDPSPAMQEAFSPGQPGLTMRQAVLPANHPIKDDTNVSDESLRHVSWGLGMGLQLDDRGRTAVCAYHSGDAGNDEKQWRGWMAVNVTENDRSAIVYFCPSPNGHILAEQIIPPVVKLNHAFNFFFKVFGFARNVNELSKEEGPECNLGLRKGSLQAREERQHQPPSPQTKLVP